MAEGINVKFSATDAGFSGTVAKVNQSMKGMDDSTRKVSASVKSSFAGMAKAGAALAVGFGAVQVGISAIRGTLDNFKEALDMGGALNDLSARTGETAGNLLVLQRAFENNGSAAEKVGPAINKLQKAIVEAGQGNGAAVDAFKRLGLNLEELKYAAPTDQMKAVGEALKGVTNPSERASIAMQVFGKSGGELLPLLMSMSEEVKNASGELGSLPGVMDRSAAAFDAIGDKMAVAKGKLTEFAAGMLESAIPALTQFVEGGAKLDAAGFGAQIGKRLSEAFSLITNGEIWELFKLNGEKAILSIQSSGAINSFAAQINNLWDQLKGDASIFNGGEENIKKYKDLGVAANTEIMDSLDARISGIVEKNTKLLADAARKMDQEAAERAAESGIMVKDIRQPQERREIPESLRRVSKTIKENAKETAKSFQEIPDFMAKAAAASNQISDSIRSAAASDKVDPGGKLQSRANEATGKGQFGKAARINERISRNEIDERIQQEFGSGRAAKDSLGDIAKRQGIDTFGKKQSDLRDELNKKAREADEKRQKELKPGQAGKTREEAEAEKNKDGGKDMMSDIKSIINDIKTTLNKIEPKLPTHALGA